MILYALACDSGHRFESWFRDSQAFEEQLTIGHVTCAVCGSAAVAKTIMSPAIVGANRPVASPASPSGSEPDSSDKTEPAPLLDERSRDLRALIRKARSELMAKGHDVGRDFAREARRIHDGQTPPRQIYGQASVGEARDLLEDGITILPLPIVPEELN